MEMAWIPKKLKAFVKKQLCTYLKIYCLQLPQTGKYSDWGIGSNHRKTL